jgi:hypothetical protein
VASASGPRNPSARATIVHAYPSKSVVFAYIVSPSSSAMNWYIAGECCLYLRFVHFIEDDDYRHHRSEGRESSQICANRGPPRERKGKSGGVEISLALQP